jgi:hypothetical protein
LLYSYDQAADSKQALNDFLKKILSMAEFTRVIMAITYASLLNILIVTSRNYCLRLRGSCSTTYRLGMDLITKI